MLWLVICYGAFYFWPNKNVIRMKRHENLSPQSLPFPVKVLSSIEGLVDANIVAMYASSILRRINYEEADLFLWISLSPPPSHPHQVNPHPTLKHKKILENLNKITEFCVNKLNTHLSCQDQTLWWEIVKKCWKRKFISESKCSTFSPITVVTSGGRGGGCQKIGNLMEFPRQWSDTN